MRIPRLTEVFVIKEASVGNIKRLLGLPDLVVSHIAALVGNKFAYPLAKVFVDDMKQWDPDNLKAARKNDAKSAEKVRDLFTMFMEGDNGLTNTVGDRLLKYLQLDPSIEKMFYSFGGGSYKLNDILSKKFEGIEGKDYMTFPDGWKWKLLSPKECSQEGEEMQHCGGAQNLMMSLRDPRGKPHVTAEVSIDNKEVYQVRGKQNKVPNQKYWHYVEALEKEVGDVRMDRIPHFKEVLRTDPSGVDKA